VSETTMSRAPRAMGYRKLSARPRHHAQAEGAIEDFKKRMARPVCKQFYRERRLISLLQRIRPWGQSLGPRWRYARSGPHKFLGVERRFLKQASGTPFDC
jgi:hypothetical protein